MVIAVYRSKPFPGHCRISMGQWGREESEFCNYDSRPTSRSHLLTECFVDFGAGSGGQTFRPASARSPIVLVCRALNSKSPGKPDTPYSKSCSPNPIRQNAKPSTLHEKNSCLSLHIYTLNPTFIALHVNPKHSFQSFAPRLNGGVHWSEPPLVLSQGKEDLGFGAWRFSQNSKP